MALGYAGWGPGQLDEEIQANGWLEVPPDDELVFGTALDAMWDRALARLGSTCRCCRPRPGTPEGRLLPGRRQRDSRHSSASWPNRTWSCQTPLMQRYLRA